MLWVKESYHILEKYGHNGRKILSQHLKHQIKIDEKLKNVHIRISLKLIKIIHIKFQNKCVIHWFTDSFREWRLLLFLVNKISQIHFHFNIFKCCRICSIQHSASGIILNDYKTIKNIFICHILKYKYLRIIPENFKSIRAKLTKITWSLMIRFYLIHKNVVSNSSVFR